VTTRSEQKSRQTIKLVREHLRAIAHKSKSLRRKSGPSYDPKQVIRRVHVLSVELDLCKLPGVYEAARTLVHGKLSAPSDDPDFESIVDVRVPRLDAAILNAGVGGWWGLDWWKVLPNLLFDGIVSATTWPKFKGTHPGMLVDGMSGRETTVAAGPPNTSRILGQVFCANVFGHYVFAHELLPLMSRARGSKVPPGRIIWESSIEALAAANFSMDDFQAIETSVAYESTKRLTDILCLTANLPAVIPYSASYFKSRSRSADRTPPRVYLTHPGIVVTTLFPLPFWMIPLYQLIVLVSRWLGSPWHPATPYGGAIAPVWLALQSQDALDAEDAERIKYGSACNRGGTAMVKKTEVEGWGWEGKVEDREALARDPAAGILRKAVGRAAGAKDLTPEKLEEFELLGAQCWREMERLRQQWQEMAGGVGRPGVETGGWVEDDEE
jgi:3-keto steroid reductase